MKHLFKLLFLFIGFSLLAASCNNTESTTTDSDTTNGIIDSMPVDNSAAGDTAIVIDSIR